MIYIYIYIYIYINIYIYKFENHLNVSGELWIKCLSMSCALSLFWFFVYDSINGLASILVNQYWICMHLILQSRGHVRGNEMPNLKFWQKTLLGAKTFPKITLKFWKERLKIWRRLLEHKSFIFFRNSW